MNINLSNNKIKLIINDDENKFIEFNPSDLQFALKVEQMYNNLKKFDVKGDIKSMIEVCDILNSDIDNIFGEGSADMIFDKQMDIYLYKQFIDQLTPFIKDASDKRVAKYLNK